MVQESYLLEELKNIITKRFLCGNNTQSLEEVRKRLQHLERKLKDCSSMSRDRRYVFMSLIAPLKETTSEVIQREPPSPVFERSSPGIDYNAFLIKIHSAQWRIKNVHQERSGVSSKEYIDSGPFNTGTDADSVGYTYRLRAYLNGRSRKKDKHLALYLIIVPGDTDGLLKWPFPYSVTISIYKKEGGLFSKTIVPDGSDSFKKPTSQLGKPIGFPRFISKEELDDCVNNDTINIVVDIQN